MTTCHRRNYENEETLRKIETSDEPVRKSNYVRYLRQQVCMNLECNMVHINACYSYLQKCTPILRLTVCLRLINSSLHFAMIAVTVQIMMVYVLKI